MKRFWLDTTLQRPWLTLLAGILFIMAAGIGGQNLYFRADYKVFFEDDNLQRVEYEEMERIFSKNENASIIIAPASGNVFNKNTLALIKEMTDEAWQTPFSTRVDSITNFQHTVAEEDDLIVEDLIFKAELINDKTIAHVKKVALSEPNLRRRLISDTGHVAMINVTVNLPNIDSKEGAFKNSAAVAEVTVYVNAMTQRFKTKYPQHDFYHTGQVYMNNAFATAGMEDSASLVPLMFGAIILVLWILLRSFTGTLATLIVIVTTIASTMGLAGWMGYYIGTATANVPIMVMTLAVADCVHVISSMLFALREGKTKDQALRYSMQLNIMPIFITSATTSIGFLTLNFSNVPEIVNMGNLTAMGVAIACIFSMTILPALLRILPMRVARVAAQKDGFIESLGEWVITNHKRLLPVSILITLVVIGFSFNNRLNDIATDYFDKSTTFRQSTDFQQENISGMMVIDFALIGKQDSALNKPEMLNLVGQFSDWLRTQPEVDHVATIADTFKRLNKNMHGDDQSYYRLPQNQELAAQYLLLYEMSLPYGLDLNNQLNVNKSGTRITATMKNLGSKEFTEFESRARDWMNDNSTSITIMASSPGLMFAHIGEKNMSSLLQGALVALVLISGLLVYALRSWRMGVISLVPNLLPAGIGFGIWAMISGEINMGLSIVLSMTLGIIVDDTVHFLSKYRHARVLRKTAEEGVRYAFASVGRALWVTTVVITIGFSILATSNFRLNSDMGLLTAIIIVVALLVDFIILPAILLVFDKKPIDDNSSDETQIEQRDTNETNEHTA